jgi:ribosome-associated heat shock protein Hsp15
LAVIDLTGGNSMGNDGKEALRLDKWLWAARFFKTRSLAADAVGGARLK